MPATHETPAARTSPEHQHHLLLRGIVNRLDGEFGSLFTRDTLEHYVHDSYDDLRSRSRVLTHLPAFVERFARQRLRALARNQGLITDHPPEVLFVCRRNDAASQIAAALFNAATEGRAFAHSAGASPSAELLTDAVHVLHEVGLDVLGAFPKPVTPEIEQAVDVIVTLDAHDDITIVDGKRYRSWNLPAPEPSSGIGGYRTLREDLDRRVGELVAEVVPPPAEGRRALADDRRRLVAGLEDLAARVTELVTTVGQATARADAAVLVDIDRSDDAVDAGEEALRAAALELIARHQPVARDLRFALAVLNAGLHLERIADGAVDVAALAGADGGTVARALPPEVGEMLALLPAMTGAAVRSLVDQEPTAASGIEASNQTLDRLAQQIFDLLLSTHGDGHDRHTALGIDRISRHLKRAGEHTLDIAEDAVFAATGVHPELGRQRSRPVS